MNKKQLRIGLRQLDDHGWFVDPPPDDLWEDLIADESTPPSDEIKQRFLKRLEARMQAAALAGVYRPKNKLGLKR